MVMTQEKKRAEKREGMRRRRKGRRGKVGRKEG